MDNKEKADFKRPFIVYRTESEKAFEGAKKICSFLLSVINCEKIYVENIHLLNSENIFTEEESKTKYKDQIVQFDLKTQQSDLCIILGGDGTVLWAKNKYDNKIIPPFLTFNLGRLGFFSYYNIENYEDIFQELFHEREFKYEKRQLLKALIYGPGENFIDKKEEEKPVSEIGLHRRKNTMGQDERSLFCLNEIVFDKGAGQKMLKIEVTVNGENFSSILCDGLLFSTPSGSSGYNLSCNGPLINYEVECFIMNAIAPFTLSWRPIVFPNNFRIQVRNLTDEPMQCTADGSIKVTMNKNNFANITMSNQYIKLIHINKYVERGYSLWKTKLTGSLGWNILPGYENKIDS